jgi:hypothetical protein
VPGRISLSMFHRVCVFVVGIATPLALAGGQDIPKLDQLAVFHIESGPLESALIQFSRQADVQVVIAPTSKANVTASAVHGKLAASAALTALLRGTGLVYAAVGNTVTVTPSSSSSSAEPLSVVSDDVAFHADQPSHSSGRRRDR